MATKAKSTAGASAAKAVKKQGKATAPAKAVKAAPKVKPAASSKRAKPAPKAKVAAKPTAKTTKAKPVSKAAVKAKPAPKTAPKPTTKPAKAKPAAKPAPKSAAKTAAKKAQPGKATQPALKAVPKSAGKKAASEKLALKTSVKTRAVAKPAPAPAAASPAKPSRPVAAAGKGKTEKRGPSTPEPTAILPERVALPIGYQPKPGEEYMSPEQLEYFRQKLLTWRADLVEESQQTMDNLRDEVRDVGDDAERATRETENSLELRTRDRYRKLISKIDKALKRIDDGEYGYCEETGEEIGLERLEARPIATLCFDAQERWEHRQRLMGD